MMNSKQTLFSLLMCVLALTSCDTQKQAIVGNELALTRAKQTLDSLSPVVANNAFTAEKVPE